MALTRKEVTRRLAAINEADRLSMYRDARAGFSGYAVAGYDRANMKASNAVFAWIEFYGAILPTDAALCIDKADR